MIFGTLTILSLCEIPEARQSFQCLRHLTLFHGLGRKLIFEWGLLHQLILLSQNLSFGDSKLSTIRLISAIFSEMGRSPTSSEGLARRNRRFADRQSFGCSVSAGCTAAFGNDTANDLNETGGDCEGATDVLSPEKGSSVKAGVEVSERATRAIVGTMAGGAEQNGTELL
jgi:hypothetical protein